MLINEWMYLYLYLYNAIDHKTLLRKMWSESHNKVQFYSICQPFFKSFSNILRQKKIIIVCISQMFFFLKNFFLKKILAKLWSAMFISMLISLKTGKPAPTSAHHEGWMISGHETVFLLGFSSLANHGNYLSCFFFFLSFFTTYPLTTHPQAGCY